MADPLGLISGLGRTNGALQPALSGTQRTAGIGTPDVGVGGQSFKNVLKAGVEEVNRAQQEATRAVEDLATGERNDVEGVIMATQKADNAFRMLQALRNKMVEAYDEIKQMRV